VVPVLDEAHDGRLPTPGDIDWTKRLDVLRDALRDAGDGDEVSVTSGDPGREPDKPYPVDAHMGD
jgi:hypothetical protein